MGCAGLLHLYVPHLIARRKVRLCIQEWLVLFAVCCRAVIQVREPLGASKRASRRSPRVLGAGLRQAKAPERFPLDLVGGKATYRYNPRLLQSIVYNYKVKNATKKVHFVEGWAGINYAGVQLCRLHSLCVSGSWHGMCRAIQRSNR